MSFLSYLINGISLGSVYAIIALGYTMVYGIARMLNFAHGDIIMVGGFTVFTIVTTMGGSPVVGILASVVVCTVLGVTIERVAYRPLRDASPLAVLITAIGVSYLLQNVALLIFGSNARQFTSVITVPALKLAGGKLSISSVTIVTILSCIVIMAALMAFINKTKMGQAMLAVSGSRCGNLDGYQCKPHDLRNLCDWFRSGGSSRRAALLGVPVPVSVHRFHAGYQGIRGSGIWRYRFDPGRIYRRYPAWYH